MFSPHSNPMYHTPTHSMGGGNIALSGFHSNSSEGSSSTPMTPASLHDPELLYPLGMHPNVDAGLSLEFGGFAHHHMGSDGMMLQDHWPSSLDATPTEADHAREKYYAQL